jgi:hypothetical protein
MDHLLELMPGDLAFLLVCFFVNEDDLLGDVTGAEEEEAFGRQAIASCPSSLLVVSLKVFRQVMVYHEAYIGFVDTHPEGDRCADDANFVS